MSDARKLVNGQLVPLSKADIAQQAIDEQDHAARKAARLDQRGFTFEGHRYEFSIWSFVALLAAWQSAAGNPEFQTEWVDVEGGRVPFDRDGMMRLGEAAAVWARAKTEGPTDGR